MNGLRVVERGKKKKVEGERGEKKKGEGKRGEKNKGGRRVKRDD